MTDACPCRTPHPLLLAAACSMWIRLLQSRILQTCVGVLTLPFTLSAQQGCCINDLGDGMRVEPVHSWHSVNWKKKKKKERNRPMHEKALGPALKACPFLLSSSALAGGIGPGSSQWRRSPRPLTGASGAWRAGEASPGFQKPWTKDCPALYFFTY